MIRCLAYVFNSLFEIRARLAAENLCFRKQLVVLKRRQLSWVDLATTSRFINRPSHKRLVIRWSMISSDNAAYRCQGITIVAHGLVKPSATQYCLDERNEIEKDQYLRRTGYCSQINIK